MNSFAKIILLTAFVIVANNSKASAGPILNGKDNDTASLKSNIVLFKMFTAPAASPANKSKSLKRAGSVARTSNNMHTSMISPKPVPNQG